MEHFKKGMGFDDSKKLSETVREILFYGLQQIKGRLCGYYVDCIHPNEMSNKMLS